MTQPGSDERLRGRVAELAGKTLAHRKHEPDCATRVWDAPWDTECTCGKATLEAEWKNLLEEAALADSPGVVTDAARVSGGGSLGHATSTLPTCIPESAAPAPSSVGQTRVEESAMASASDDYDWTAACLHLLMCGKDPSCKRCREIEAHIKATGGDSHD
jgi:hypothetical protein